jgi:hypothetical protein
MKFRSKYEKRVAEGLDNFRIPYTYEGMDVSYSKRIRGAVCKDCDGSSVVVTRKYVPDFHLPHDIIIEAKGKFTPENRTKMLEVIESNPDLDIRMLFMYNNWLTRKKKNKYGDWCDKYDIKWGIGPGLPTAWIKECQQSLCKSNHPTS